MKQRWLAVGGPKTSSLCLFSLPYNTQLQISIWKCGLNCLFFFSLMTYFATLDCIHELFHFSRDPFSAYEISSFLSFLQDTNRLEYLIPKKSSLRHRLPMGDQGFIDFVAHLLEVNPDKRPSASEALKHPWLQYPYEPISS